MHLFVGTYIPHVMCTALRWRVRMKFQFLFFLAMQQGSGLWTHKALYAYLKDNLQAIKFFRHLVGMAY